MQLKRPKNFDDWLKSWKVYETLYIMKDIATLRQYETKMRKLNNLYGADHWGFIWEAHDFDRTSPALDPLRSCRGSAAPSSGRPATLIGPHQP